jgi:hypothetical protein
LLAVAVMGILVLTAFNSSLDSRLEKLDLAPQVQETLDEERARLGGAEVPDGVDNELRVALEQAIAESFVSGFRLAMWVAAGLALVSALTAALMIEGKKAVQKSVPALAE